MTTQSIALRGWRPLGPLPVLKTLTHSACRVCFWFAMLVVAFAFSIAWYGALGWLAVKIAKAGWSLGAGLIF